MRPTDGPILEVRDVQLTFGGVVALDGPSFTVERGAICGLIGPNGAGKTTLFNCISLIYRPHRGDIVLNGESIIRRRIQDIARLGVARTFQNLGLFSHLTVLENVLVGAYPTVRQDMFETVLLPWVQRRIEKRHRLKAADVLAELGLDDVADEMPSNLPFGTLKRVELARAMMSDPQLLILDEPANGLIQGEVTELAETVAALRRDRGLTVLLVEHHMGMVMSISEQVVVLSAGRKIADGTPSQVRQDPAVIEAYLGGAV